jgi:hypothetical protein
MFVRRLLQERTVTAREYHHCDVGFPNCTWDIICPGDRYTRETWLYAGVRGDGTKFRYITIRKRHDCPCCDPDPSAFEEEERQTADTVELKIAA